MEEGCCSECLVKIRAHFHLGFILTYQGGWSGRGKSGAAYWGRAAVGSVVPLQHYALISRPVTHLKATMDPVAAKSSFLCMYMSAHKDTLASYVIYHGKVTNTKITNAEMTGIDSKVPAILEHHMSRPHCLIVLSTQGMNISYRTPSSGNEKISVRIEFEPPLSGYEEVKPRLLSMKADAEESLGMVRVAAAATFRPVC